jgi:NADH-quinone oxidoreductase subunit J
MNLAFYISAAVAVVATLMVITRANAVHALLYLIVSLLAVAVVFYMLGAPFVAALEVLIYAGAVMVLFIFAIMLLNLGPATVRQEREWLRPRVWAGPALLAVILLAEVVYIVGPGRGPAQELPTVGARKVGAALFGPYLVGVGLASLVLLAALVGAYHLGRRERPSGRGGA